MKTVTVKLTIDQWVMDSIANAVGELADIEQSYRDDEELGNSPILRDLNHKSRSIIENGHLWDVYEILLAIAEQSRNQ